MAPTPQVAAKPVTKKTGSQVTDEQTAKAASKANESADRASKSGDATKKAAPRRSSSQSSKSSSKSQRPSSPSKSKDTTQKTQRDAFRTAKATGAFDVRGSGHRLFYVAFFASVAVISWQEIKVFKRMPLPSRFISAGVAYGLLAVLEGLTGEDIAGVLAWGLFTGLVYSQIGANSDNGGKVPVVANVSTPSGVTPIEFSRNTPAAQGGNTPKSTGGGKSAAKKLTGGATA